MMNEEENERKRIKLGSFTTEERTNKTQTKAKKEKELDYMVFVREREELNQVAYRPLKSS